MRRIDLRVGQRLAGVAIDESVGHALLPGGHVLAPENIKQLDAFQVLWLHLLDYVEYCFVRCYFGNKHRHVATNRRKCGQGLE